MNVDSTLLVLEADGWIRAGDSKASADAADVASEALAYLRQTEESVSCKQLSKAVECESEACSMHCPAWSRRAQSTRSRRAIGSCIA